MELLNVGRRGKDRYTRLEHGLQHMRPKVRLGIQVCYSCSYACIIRFHLISPDFTVQKLSPFNITPSSLQSTVSSAMSS